MLLAILLAMGTSCKKYLDVKPNGRTVPNTAEEFAAIVHSILNRIDYGSDETLLGNSTTVLDLESYSENLDASVGEYKPGISVAVYAGSHINKQQKRYADHYSVIKDCNIILANLENDGRELNSNVLGVAYAMRAISYYNLLREYCGTFESNEQPGLALIEDFDMEAQPARSSYGETASFIERDLKKAISFQVKQDVFRFTEDVSRAYLARLYFWTEQWDKAAEVAEDLLIRYPLVKGDEYVKLIQSRNTGGGNVLLRTFYFSNQSSNINYEKSMELIQTRPVTRELVELFTEKDQDIRYTFYFNSHRLSTKNLFANIRTDEMCLMLAEIFTHKGDHAKALSYLNMLRAHRIVHYKPLTMTSLPTVKSYNVIKQDASGKPLSALMQAVLNERRKELYAEGDRFFELKRNGSPEFWVAFNGFKYTMEPYLYTYPLPRIDVEISDGLVQNPGYEKLK